MGRAVRRQMQKAALLIRHGWVFPVRTIPGERLFAYKGCFFPFARGSG
jgi:hypothetical protein